MIKLMAFDVDGVLTDSRLHYGPEGEPFKTFCARDGIAFHWLNEMGIKTALISGHGSPALYRRAEALGIDVVRAPENDKFVGLIQVADSLGVKLEDVGMVGDDLQDLKAMRLAGWSACPADAVHEVCLEAKYCSPIRGGHGAARDIIEYMLRDSGRLAGATAGYFPGT